MKYYRAMLASLTFAFMLLACAQDNDVDIPVGVISADHLLAEFPLFTQEYHDFELSQSQLAQIHNWPENLQVFIYFGTWCHDSQREVPRMLKVLAQNPTISAHLIALNLKKADPDGLSVSSNVLFTPTFVILVDDKEIGRITERPKTTLIGDINAMLTI